MSNNAILSLDYLALRNQVASEKQRLAQLIPDEAAALQMIATAMHRLGDLGFKPAVYCPKDGTLFEAVEAGTLEIIECFYLGKWPDGSWIAVDQDDAASCYPILFRLKPQPDGTHG